MSFQVEIGSVGETVFPDGTLYPSTNFVIFIMTYWYRHASSSAPKKKNVYFFTLTFFFPAVYSI